MDVVTWMLIGGIVGWAGHAYLNLNAERGVLVSMIIGAAGGYIGGEVIAPMFTAGALAADDFSAAALAFAAAVAAAFLAGGNLIYKRWGV
jgi:uncharacterized membrane protein YeaQ/YmgE (transglycosylase-associated protein family)